MNIVVRYSTIKKYFTIIKEQIGKEIEQYGYGWFLNPLILVTPIVRYFHLLYSFEVYNFLYIKILILLLVLCLWTLANTGKNALFEFVESDNLIMVKFLIFVFGHSPDSIKNNTKQSLLHVAAENKANQVAKYLIDKDVDINVKDEPKGYKPIYYAATKSNDYIVNLLFQKNIKYEIDILKLLIKQNNLKYLRLFLRLNDDRK